MNKVESFPSISLKMYGTVGFVVDIISPFRGVYSRLSRRRCRQRLRRRCRLRRHHYHYSLSSPLLCTHARHLNGKVSTKLPFNWFKIVTIVICRRHSKCVSSLSLTRIVSRSSAHSNVWINKHSIHGIGLGGCAAWLCAANFSQN